MFLLPYLSMGGAEQVHLGVVDAVKDEAPLVIFGGFSKDRAFEERFARIATILEIPRLLNHPWTRKAALQRVANALRPAGNKTLFGSLSQHFFDLLPLLDPAIRAFHMQHAFLYQPEANHTEKQRLRHFSRITGYLFPSRMARDEFGKFLFHQNMPADAMNKLFVVPCAAPEFGTVRPHEQLGILFVGRDSAEKRAGLFLDIVAELELRKPGRFRFTMAGPKARPGSPHVSFTGPIGPSDEMVRLYAANDILVLTSTREGHCLVVTEAMAQGLAVVATPVGDVADRVSDATGLLTSTIERDMVLRETVARILALDKDRGLLERTRRNALELVSGRYTRAEFRTRYRALLITPASSE
jgi:glycosyltransferase involved in cell wall biosynthesis